jgi:hypothetical protein
MWGKWITRDVCKPYLLRVSFVHRWQSTDSTPRCECKSDYEACEACVQVCKAHLCVGAVLKEPQLKSGVTKIREQRNRISLFC